MDETVLQGLKGELEALRITMHREAEDHRLVLHTLTNAVNAMSLKLEVVLAHIRRRGE